MTYNTDPRKPLRGKARQAFLIAHGSICYWCEEPITDDQWDDEHVIARELIAPGAGADAMSNRLPIHRGACHKAKTARDRKDIAKSNRIRQKHGLDPRRRRQRKPIVSRKDWPAESRPIPTRPFPKRERAT